MMTSNRSILVHSLAGQRRSLTFPDWLADRAHSSRCLCGQLNRNVLAALSLTPSRPACSLLWVE